MNILENLISSMVIDLAEPCRALKMTVVPLASCNIQTALVSCNSFPRSIVNNLLEIFKENVC
jgi:hypothetical protein